MVLPVFPADKMEGDGQAQGVAAPAGLNQKHDEPDDKRQRCQPGENSQNEMKRIGKVHCLVFLENKIRNSRRLFKQFLRAKDLG